MFSTSLILAVLLFSLLAVFFLGLPNLQTCLLPRDVVTEGQNNHKHSSHVLLCGCITLVYAVIAFINLGTTSAPAVFKEFTAGAQAVIELQEVSEIDHLMLYTGINVGDYSIETSIDGEQWDYYTSFSQDYASLLKWQKISSDYITPVEAKYIRITGESGNPRVGEIAAVSFDGTVLSLVNPESSPLTDEQETVPEESNYLNSTYFDEIYHARTAEEYIQGIYPYECSHPPLGKAIIMLGILLFGLNPFGWRFMGTLFGVLMVPIMYAFAWKLFHRRSVACVCAVIFAFDFMHYTQTRIATIDTYGVFFILLMYLFFWCFMQEPLPQVGVRNRKKTVYLFLSGVSFGIGCACKWICVYAGAGLAVLWVAYHFNRRKEETISGFLHNVLVCIPAFVLIPCCIYYVSYYPYGTASGLHGIGAFFTKEYLDIVIQNQEFMFNYHSHLVATHPYSSKWYQWILDIRPILYYLEYFDDGTRSSFGAFVSPLLCWGGLLSLFAAVYSAIVRRDRTAAFLVAGYLAQLLPWVLITRLTFEYHYFPSTVFLTLALGWCCSVIRENRQHWNIYLGGLSFCSILLFVMFYPVISGLRVNAATASAILQWLPTWPF